VDPAERFDLVAMSVFTRSARRAYALARAYRDKKVPVLMGGFHPTLDPKDASPHADALILGEGEDTWPEALRDALAGRLRPVYRRADFHSLENLPVPRYDLMPRGRYRIPIFPVQTSRGCPFACSFCEVTQVYGRRYRLRPVPEVIAEIKQARLPSVHFVDDNFAADRDRTLDLMEKLIPLKIGWTCLLTVKDAADEPLLDLARRAGCRHINIGMESIQPGSLRQMRKMQNRVADYERALALLNKKGMFYSLNFIFGWDTDTPRVFADTADFLDRHRVPMAVFFMLVPRVGTKIYDQLKAEGRIIADEAYDGRNPRCMFVPKGMPPRDLEEGVWWIHRRFYSPLSMLRRRIFTPGPGYLERLLSNLLFSLSSRLRLSPLDFY
jgi:radical SAM superfamily enzyme YgiQ (UPF0313 family)